MTTSHTTLDRENPAQKWKFGDEYLPFHPQASHVNPDYRDVWNRAYWAAQTAKAAPEGVMMPYCNVKKLNQESYSIELEGMAKAEVSVMSEDAQEMILAHIAEWMLTSPASVQPLAVGVEARWIEGKPQNLVAAAEDADEWLKLIQRLTASGKWEFSERQSPKQLHACREALRKFIAGAASPQPPGGMVPLPKAPEAGITPSGTAMDSGEAG